MRQKWRMLYCIIFCIDRQYRFCYNIYKEILTDYKFNLIHEEHLEEKTTCNSYLYDIYKYKPQKRPDFSKFSKEDFEL